LKKLHAAEQELFAAFTEDLTRFETANIDLSTAETAIEVCRMYLSQLKALVQEHGFADKDEEIVFFKHSKPRYLVPLIYYKGIYTLYSQWPEGSEIMKKEYLDHELSRLRQFFAEHREFYKYCRTCSTHMDDKYFVRGQFDVHLLHDSFYFEADPGFSTNYDFLVSQITANTRLLTYIEKLLLQPDGSTSGSPSADSSKAPSLTWTGSKTDLIELIYALHSGSVLNNGNADLKLIATCLQKVFNIEVGNYYDIFQHIRLRKTGRTKFLDNLRSLLIKKMDEME
jgi:hypothetical protein